MKAPSHYSSFEVDQLAAALWEAALQQRLPRYGDVSPIVGLEPYNPTFWGMLGEISEDTERRFGVMLTALVVTKAEGSPGGEFYELAIDLGRGVNDRLEFWAREVQAVFNKAQELKGADGHVNWDQQVTYGQ